ncbi:hypothetical protein [Achromobacter sp. 2789STDY5608615]|uniref:hypothetical protein n=1 Tax=Achromobacter sp. 2789STDY5608615 TaxID=1806492 RepID=UPI0012E1C7EC|nr:hypothetical protein [Achromobacter sp. 2789STDY5608615]
MLALATNPTKLQQDTTDFDHPVYNIYFRCQTQFMTTSHSAPTPMGSNFDLGDVIVFLRSNVITIFICGTIGLLAGAAHIWLTPKQYESVGLIQSALTTSSTNLRRGSSAPQIPVEDSALTIARLQIPSSYTDAVVKLCEPSSSGPLNREAMLSIVKPTINRMSPGAIELRVRREDPAVAQACAQAVFEMIRQQQIAMTEPMIKSLEEQRTTAQAQIASGQDMIRKMESAQEKSVAYLITRDETLVQQDRLHSIDNDIGFITRNPTSLLAPWYTPETPVLPKVRITLLAGLLAGPLIGVLYALGRQVLRTSVRHR